MHNYILAILIPGISQLVYITSFIYIIFYEHIDLFKKKKSGKLRVTGARDLVFVTKSHLIQNYICIFYFTFSA